MKRASWLLFVLAGIIAIPIFAFAQLVQPSSQCSTGIQQALSSANSVLSSVSALPPQITNQSIFESATTALMNAIDGLSVAADCGTAPKLNCLPNAMCGIPVVLPASTNPSGVVFPATILVTASSLNVRSAPNTTASLAGSQTLVEGNEFAAVNEVVGESVNGNDLWWVSSSGNYVWSGGTTVETSVAKLPVKPKGVVGQNIVQQVNDSNGNQYSVTYNYLPDGEVQATFVYKGQTLTVAFFGTSNQVVALQSNGTEKPYAYLSDINLTKLINGPITSDLPSPKSIFPGFTFATPLYDVDDASPFYVDTPANAFEITQSPYTNIPTPGLYDLTTDANGNLIGVTPVNISTTGAITTGTEIVLTAKGPVAPTMSSADLQSAILQAIGFQAAVTLAQNAGYIVEINSVGGSFSAVILDPQTNAVVAAVNQSNS